MRTSIRQRSGTLYLAVGSGIRFAAWQWPERGTHDLYKIGFSVDPGRRVRDIRNFFGGDWRLIDSFPGTYEIERAMHQALQHLRSPRAPRRFREYYRRSPAVRACWNRAKRRIAE